MAGAMALYRTAVNRALGDGAWEAFKGLNVTDSDMSELINSKKLGGLGRGQSFTDEVTGNRYRIVRARGTITDEGYLLKQYFGAAGRVGNLVAASTKAVITTDDSFTAHDLARGLVFLNAGTGVGELRPIMDNDGTVSASTITVVPAGKPPYPGAAVADWPDNFVALPDATTDYVSFVPWEVVHTSGVTDYTVAWALGAVTDGNWTIVLERGYGIFRGVGSTDAFTAGGPIVPSATAGVAKGFTTAGELAAEARLSCGMSLVAYSGASAPWFGKLHGKFLIGDN